MIKIADEPLSLADLKELSNIPADVGSLTIHLAVVKPTAAGKATNGIQFSAGGDIESELRAIEGDLTAKWNTKQIWLIRRLGSLKVGDVISIVAAAAERKEEAIGACNEAVERFKKMKTIRKQELFDE